MLSKNTGGQLSANLRPDFINQLTRTWRCRFEPREHGQMPRVAGARDVLDYVYGLVFDAEYRRRFGDRLAVEFPRIPLTTDSDLAAQLCRFGRRLVELHTLLGESSVIGRSTWTCRDACRGGQGYPKFVPEQLNRQEPSFEALEGSSNWGRLYLDRDTVLAPVHVSDWQFRLGGYPVIQRWLKTRRGKVLRRFDRDYVEGLLNIAAQTRITSEEIRRLLSSWY